MRILITGGCGYIGSKLLQSVSELKGVEAIRILDNFSSGSRQALMNLPKGIKFEVVEGDILNNAIVSYAMQGIDIVIHLAGLVKTPMSFGDPNRLEQINHWGTQNLLEHALNNKVKQFIYTSSTAVYGPAMENKKEDEFRPFGHYANSIYNTEQSLFGYQKRGLPITILRLGTIYGVAPHMRFVSVINRLVHMAATKKMLTVFGQGQQVRPFIHVKDAVNAIFYAVSNKERLLGTALNVLENNYTINEIAQHIQKADPSVKLHFTDQDIRNHFSFLIKHDLFTEAGWKPEISLEAGIKEQLGHYNGFTRLML